MANKRENQSDPNDKKVSFHHLAPSRALKPYIFGYAFLHIPERSPQAQFQQLLPAGTVTINIDLVGESPGIFTVTENFTSTGTYACELAGTAGAGDSLGHDQIVVGQLATISDTLEVSLLDSFKVTIGQQFEIVKYDSLVGKFDTLNLHDIHPLTWSLQYPIEVATSHNQYRLNIENLTSGIYLVQLRIGGKSMQKQVILVH